MDFTLTDEQLAWRASVIDFARSKLNAGVAERERERGFYLQGGGGGGGGGALGFVGNAGGGWRGGGGSGFSPCRGGGGAPSLVFWDCRSRLFTAAPVSTR